MRGSGVRVVAKRHPYCRSATIERALKDLVAAGDLIVDDGSVRDLIAGALAVVTVNSGVGFEALVHGKPVITTGRSAYGYAAHPVADADELTVALRNFPAHETQRARRLFDYYLSVHTASVVDKSGVIRMIQRWLTVA
jgi:capsule polysaccharide modification protein KpsS